MPTVNSAMPTRRLPLLGLLLSLLLYVGGGVLAAGHLHHDGVEVADHACATCLLAAATVAAVGAVSLLLPVIAIKTLSDVALRRRAFTVAHRPRARAPPALLI